MNPTGQSGAERRRYPRWKIHRALEAGAGGEAPERVVSRDVSSCGIAIDSTRRFRAGAPIRIRVTLSAGNSTMLVGSVVRCSPARDSAPPWRYRVAVAIEPARHDLPGLLGSNGPVPTDDRRRATRAALWRPVAILPEIGEPVGAITQDASTSGLRVWTTVRLAPSSRVTVRLPGSPGRPPAPFSGRVVRVERLDDPSLAPWAFEIALALT